MEITFKVSYRKDGAIMLHGVKGESGIHLNLNKFKENLSIVNNEDVSNLVGDALIERGKQYITDKLSMYESNISFCISGWAMNLSPEMKEAAELLAIGSITYKDVEEMFHIKREDLPRRFFNHMKNYRKQVEAEMEEAYIERCNNALKRATKWDLVDQIINLINEGLSPEKACEIYHI